MHAVVTMWTLADALLIRVGAVSLAAVADRFDFIDNQKGICC
jgi:hypothetical protein